MENKDLCGVPEPVAQRHERQLCVGWEKIEQHDRQINHLFNVVDILKRGDSELSEKVLTLFAEHERKDRERAESDQRFRANMTVTTVLSLLGITGTFIAVILKG